MPIFSTELDRYANRSWRVTDPPASEPVTVTEFKQFARIDCDSSEDVLLEAFIIAVRDAVEKYLHRALMEQEITLVMDFWPESEWIELPNPPLISVDGIYTVDEDDIETEFDSNYYYIDDISEPGKLHIKQSCVPPTNSTRDYSGFKIVYTVGYGDAEDVPELIKLAIKLWTTIVYETKILDLGKPPAEVSNLLNMYRVVKV
jgi:uncharacterized phiE125 gp8 family phage protein